MAAAEINHGELYALMMQAHRRLDDLLEETWREEGARRDTAYQEFRELLLKHIRIEERVLLPRAAKKRGEPLELAARLRLDHGAFGAMLMLPPRTSTLHALRSLLALHNPLEEDPGGVYDQCEALVASPELMAEIAAAPSVRASAWVDNPKVTASARRVLEHAGRDPKWLDD